MKHYAIVGKIVIIICLVHALSALPPHPIFNALEDSPPKTIEIIASKMSRDAINYAYPTECSLDRDAESSTTPLNTVTPLLFALTRADKDPDDLLESVRYLLICGAHPNVVGSFKGHQIHPFEYVVTTLPHRFNIIRPALVELFLHYKGKPTEKCWTAINKLRPPYNHLRDVRADNPHVQSINEDYRYYQMCGDEERVVRSYERTFIEHENLMTSLNILGIFIVNSCKPPDNFLYHFFHNMLEAGSSYDQPIFSPTERYTAYGTLHDSLENSLNMLIARYPYLLEHQISQRDGIHSVDDGNNLGTLDSSTLPISYSPCTGDTVLTTLIRRLLVLTSELSETPDKSKAAIVTPVVLKYARTLVSCGANPNTQNIYGVSARSTAETLKNFKSLGDDDTVYNFILSSLEPPKQKQNLLTALTQNVATQSRQSVRNIGAAATRFKDKLRLPRQTRQNAQAITLKTSSDNHKLYRIIDENLK